MYFVATKHDEFAAPEFEFPSGSVVLDPWRFIPPRAGVEVVPVGVGGKPAAVPALESAALAGEAKAG